MGKESTGKTKFYLSNQIDLGNNHGKKEKITDRTNEFVHKSEQKIRREKINFLYANDSTVQQIEIVIYYKKKTRADNFFLHF